MRVIKLKASKHTIPHTFLSEAACQLLLEDAVSNTRGSIGQERINERRQVKLAQVKIMKEHEKKMTKREDEWGIRLPGVIQHIIRCTAFVDVKCTDCGTVTAASVKCESCRKFLCWSCDEGLHTIVVLHNRKVCPGGLRLLCLAQNEFLSSNEDKFEKGNSYSSLVDVLSKLICHSSLYRCVSFVFCPGRVPFLWQFGHFIMQSRATAYCSRDMSRYVP